MSGWCARNPKDQEVPSFTVDAWIAFAKAASPAEALALLEEQPEEVKLAFESVRDAFLAHADKDHLHRLAPERRAPVLKLLERLDASQAPDIARGRAAKKPGESDWRLSRLGGIG